MVGGSYDITGFHTTGRQRLTQGLMSGHMRSQRTSIFPSHTTIINNIGTCHYADYGCYDTHSYDSTPKWASWLMGGGMIASFLGGIFGGGKLEGAGGASDNTDNNAKLKDDIKALQKQFPDAKLSVLSDGTILCDGKKYDSLDDVIDALNQPKNPENVVKKDVEEHNIVENTGDDGNGPADEGKLKGANEDSPDVKPVVDTQPVTNEANVHKTTSVVKKAKNTGSSPAGWYKATSDFKDNVKGITIENLKNAQKSGKSAATYVLEQVLATKGGLTQALSNNSKAQLLGEIIRKNPSVFNSDGSLKDGADISKLDVPSAKWVENTYGVNRTQSGQGFKKQEKTDNYYVVRGNNGYHAKYDKKNKTWTYHNPQGQQIPEKDFQKVCKNIYAQTKGINGKNNVSKANATNKGKSQDTTHYTANLVIKPGKYPVATFKDKNGKTKTFTGRSSGVSFSPTTRQNAQIEDIKRQIKEAGYTNVTLARAE